MTQILFWHVVSHSEENDKQVPTLLLSTHQIQKYLDPISSLPQVHCSIKRNTTDFKKKLNNRAPFNWETERTGTESVVASMIKTPQYADQTPPSCHTTGTQAMVRAEELRDRHMIQK